MPSLAERALSELGSEAESFTMPSAPPEAATRGQDEPTFESVAARMTGKPPAPAAVEPTPEPDPTPEGEDLKADDNAPFADVLEQIAKAESASKPVQPADSQPADPFAEFKTKYPDTIGRYNSLEDLAEGHLNLRKKLSERDQEAELGRLARENPQAILQWYQEQAPQLFDPYKQPVAEAVTEDLELELLKYVDPSKMPADLRKKAEAWAAQKQIEKVPIVQSLKQEIAALKQQLGKAPEVTPDLVDQTVHQRLEFQTAANKAAQYVHTHSKGLFNGGDPRRGLSEAGKEWAAGVQWAEQHGANVDEAIAQGEMRVKARFGSILGGTKTPDAAQHRNTRTNAAPANNGRMYDPQKGMGLAGSILSHLGLDTEG